MSETVMRKHINLYVNDHSLDLGTTGKNAIIKLLDVYQQNKPTTALDRAAIFLESVN